MDNGKLNKSSVHEKISLYLDNALDPIQREEFVHQIQVNPHLNHAVEKEKQFRSVIKNKLDRPKLEPDFIQYIKDQIHWHPGFPDGFLTDMGCGVSQKYRIYFETSGRGEQESSHILPTHDLFWTHRDIHITPHSGFYILSSSHFVSPRWQFPFVIERLFSGLEMPSQFEAVLNIWSNSDRSTERKSEGSSLISKVLVAKTNYVNPPWPFMVDQKPTGKSTSRKTMRWKIFWFPRDLHLSCLGTWTNMVFSVIPAPANFRH